MRSLNPLDPSEDLPALAPSLADLIDAGLSYDGRSLLMRSGQSDLGASRPGAELEVRVNHSCLSATELGGSLELRRQASTFARELGWSLVSALPRHTFDVIVVLDPEAGKACVRAHQSGSPWLGCVLDAQPYPVMVLRVSGVRKDLEHCDREAAHVLTR
jgi:hypothetical protein